MPKIVSPIDGRVAFSYEELTLELARARLEQAARVQREWQEVPLERRIAVCIAMLDAYAARLDTHADAITRMMGKPLSQAKGEFTGGMSERTRHMCGLAPAALADERLPVGDGLQRFIRHEPVGVVLDIAAWNYPLLIPINVVVPAVLAGNAVLVKHAHQTAPVAEQLEAAFVAAGAPVGLVQALPIDHPTAAALIREGGLGQVAFTGSVRGGREVRQVVAEASFIRAGYELGGKDPAIVLEDADLARTVDCLVDGRFYNAGQSCCAVERIYVARPSFDRFVEAYAARVATYRLGDPLHPDTTLGPMASSSVAREVARHVDAALAAGARSVISPTAFDVPDTSDCYVAPQVLVDVHPDMDLMREETFGPAIGIMPFDSIDEAIALANDSRYGLTASVWTTDVGRIDDIARRLQAGTIFLNRCDYLDPGLAWAGTKDSGLGCSLSRFGFLEVTRLKSHHYRPWS